MAAYPPYTVLMSLYARENPVWLRSSLDSIQGQTVPPSQVVLVKDGDLTPELDGVLEEYERSYPSLFKIIGYHENRGLGYALMVGLGACDNEMVARMDTDDYAMPNRCEQQLKAFESDASLGLLGTQITEFLDSPSKPVSNSGLPETYEDIVACSKRRNPFRHPSMMFKKSVAVAAGGYSPEFLYFEDWDLFNRMLMSGCHARNLHEPLVATRISPDFFGRRGGLKYLSHTWRFKAAQFKRGWFSPADLACSFLPHAIVCLMPNSLRTLVYTKLLRKPEAKIDA